MDTKWIPFGEFELQDGGDIIFKGRVTEVEVSTQASSGPAQPPARQKRAAVGPVRSNRIFNGGSISVDVKFTPPEAEIAKEGYPTTAEFIVYKNPQTGEMVTAG